MKMVMKRTKSAQDDIVFGASFSLLPIILIGMAFLVWFSGCSSQTRVQCSLKNSDENLPFTGKPFEIKEIACGSYKDNGNRHYIVWEGRYKSPWRFGENDWICDFVFVFPLSLSPRGESEFIKESKVQAIAWCLGPMARFTMSGPAIFTRKGENVLFSLAGSCGAEDLSHVPCPWESSSPLTHPRSDLWNPGKFDLRICFPDKPKEGIGEKILQKYDLVLDADGTLRPRTEPKNRPN